MLQLPGSSLVASASDGCQEGCEEGREEVSGEAWGGLNMSELMMKCGSRMLLHGVSELVLGRAGDEWHRFA